MPRRKTLPLKLTAKRANGLRAVRMAADILLSGDECSDETRAELRDGIDWIDRLLMLRGPREPVRPPIRVLVIKGGR